MKNFFAILSSVLFLTACSQKQNTENSQAEEESVVISVDENGDETIIKEKIVPPAVIPESETFYNMDTASALVISDPITYNVEIKNYNPNDDWKDECLANTDRMALCNAIFQAVYKGRLTPIDYFREEVMPIDSVKSLEKRFSRNEIGRLVFTEKWYFSENTLQFTKEVISVTMGYEHIDPNTKENLGFKPVFMVKLK